MKLFNIAALIGVTAASSVSSISRHRRSGTVQYSLTGEENPDQLMEILTEIANGEEDELERFIMNIMADDPRTLSLEQTRKFRNLKILVLWLQKEQKFGRYCFYGCYCLPEGSHNIAAGGYGKPLDGIDKACFDFKQCYKCLIDEHEVNQPDKTWADQDQCKGENIGYRADLIINPDGTKSIECQNKAGECRRNICECDKALAQKLAIEEDNWNVDLHEIKGNFKRDENCYKPQGGGSPFVECCGDTFTFPFNQPRRENQCCDGTDSKPAGTC